MAIMGVCLRQTSLRVLRKRLSVLKSYDRFFRGPVKHFEERIYNRIDRPYDVTLSRVFERAASNKIFLKVDIEGSEYRIIDAIAEFADRIVGLVVEFHDTDPLRPVFVDAIRKLQQHFEIVHVHANKRPTPGALRSDVCKADSAPDTPKTHRPAPGRCRCTEHPRPTELQDEIQRLAQWKVGGARVWQGRDRDIKDLQTAADVRLVDWDSASPASLTGSCPRARFSSDSSGLRLSEACWATGTVVRERGHSRFLE
jgi:hypothetical protein